MNLLLVMFLKEWDGSVFRGTWGRRRCATEKL